MAGSGRTAVPPFHEFLAGRTAPRSTGSSRWRGPQDADDVFQETFIGARAYPRVREPHKLDRWILAIASRKAIDHYRGAGR